MSSLRFPTYLKVNMRSSFSPIAHMLHPNPSSYSFLFRPNSLHPLLMLPFVSYPTSMLLFQHTQQISMLVSWLCQLVLLTKLFCHWAFSAKQYLLSDFLVTNCVASPQKLTVSFPGQYTTSRTWKQPKCLSTDEWMKEMWYIYAMEYYSAIKVNKTGSFVVT